MRWLIYILLLLVVLYLAALFIPIDPDERRPGLTLAGPMAAEQDPTWTDYPSPHKIYVQVAPSFGLPYSITTISWVDEQNNFYVPCARCGAKRWPRQVAKDPAVTLKIDGQLYERSAVRVTDQAQLQALLDGLGRDDLPDDVWVYRMETKVAF